MGRQFVVIIICSGVFLFSFVASSYRVSLCFWIDLIAQTVQSAWVGLWIYWLSFWHPIMKCCVPACGSAHGGGTSFHLFSSDGTLSSWNTFCRYRPEEPRNSDRDPKRIGSAIVPKIESIRCPATEWRCHMRRIWCQIEFHLDCCCQTIWRRFGESEKKSLKYFSKNNGGLAGTQSSLLTKADEIQRIPISSNVAPCEDGWIRLKPNLPPDSIIGDGTLNNEIEGRCFNDEIECDVILRDL